MICITLPDGSKREFEQAPSVYDVAYSIGPGLAKAALVGKVDGQLVDLKFLIETDAQLAIITARDEEGVAVLRHSTAHLMAQAVQQLFPDAQVTIGPVIEDGFFYDFAYQRPFNDEDLLAIEARMQALSKSGDEITRKVLSRNDAKAYFDGIGEKYKVEIIDSIPESEALSLYTQGEFTDLCRGPHVRNTAQLGAFKLMKVAGAYWRGDNKNAMLTRIYGTAWPDAKQLKQYLHRLAEAEKRDHRRIGKQLDLFHLQEEAPGMVFWHPAGWKIYQATERYMREKLDQGQYQEIKTPQIVDRSLWERSGHWDKYSDAMFTTNSEERDFAIKPMNCPCHVQVFNQGLRSYRDLPLRFSEFGSCHRNELSGALHGIMRVRGFTQDDGHIFCTEGQIESEAQVFIEMLHDVYRDFGFKEIIYKLSTRPKERVGSDEVWDKSERALADALNAAGLDWQELPGEGAFYGPKIEFSLKDCIGRVWQCGTLQVDFNMPQRLDAQYVDQNGDRQTPVMLHRAILGSFERFIGILIENFEGKFPTWLAPTQAMVLNITDAQAEKVSEITQKLKDLGFRVDCDLRNEKVGFKIRKHTLARVPYLLVIGEREKDDNTVAVRARGGEDLGVMTLEDFVKTLNTDIARRGTLALEE